MLHRLCRACDTPLGQNFFYQERCVFWYGERNEALDSAILDSTPPVGLRFCPNCGLIQLDVTDGLTKILKTVYSSSCSKPGATHGQNTAYSEKLTADYFRAYEELAGDWIPEAVLEIGCQSGRLLYDYERRGSKVCIGVEPSDIQPFSRPDGTRIDVRHDFFTPDVVDSDFDFAFCLQVLEHIDRPQEFLGMMRDVLRPGGRILIGVPNEELALISGNIGMVIHQHLNYFTRDSLGYLLGQAGFKPLRYIHTQDQPLYVLAEKCEPSVQPSPIECAPSLKALANEYVASMQDKFDFIREIVRRSEGKVGLYGANCAMANIFSWMTDIDESKLMVFDGDPKKQGKYYSGIPLKIHAPADLCHVDDVIVVPYRLQDQIISYLTHTHPISATVHRLY
ncbi:MAG: class I SAM-dependent methyltransferase [Pseudodesulfovibrio sp.]|nr:class I SAM-dependent methyltransferase [Pseudodesulfovibrio sp.]